VTGAEADKALQKQAVAAAQSLAESLAKDGARAVALTGSFALGQGHPESDLDLIALGDGPEYRLFRSEPFLVSLAFRSPEAVRNEFANPMRMCTSVPGWRSAVILHDVAGEAAALKADADAWTWERVRQITDAWVADELTGLAEEVHKLVMRRAAPGNDGLALGGYLAVQLPRVMCVRHRRLYGTDSRLWEEAAEAMGPEWAANVETVFGTSQASLQERCQAALRLYATAAESVSQLLDERQAAVVSHALQLISTL
jgi:hypothetical protein